MSEGGYPLEAARTVRAYAEDAAGQSLADALHTREKRRLDRNAAEASLDGHRTQEAERARLAGVPARQTAMAVQREAAYRTRQREREGVLQGKLDRTRKAERDADAAVTGARRALGNAAAERAVVEKHHERWAGKRKAAKEKAEENEREDRRTGG